MNHIPAQGDPSSRIRRVQENPAQFLEAFDAMWTALNHPLLYQLMGDIEDSGTDEARKLWSLVHLWSELQAEAFILAAEVDPKEAQQ
jgi:hypothetical protein